MKSLTQTSSENPPHMPTENPLKHHSALTSPSTSVHPPNPTFQTPSPYSSIQLHYTHDSDSSEDLVTSKGSLPLPMHLSTRLLVARKSRESEKKNPLYKMGG